MPYQKPHPPVIIIGMHRSGTSMVSRALAAAGLFTGKMRDPNDEALFFMRLNRWLLRQAGGAWDRPEPIHDLWHNTEVRELTADYLRYAMTTPHVASYLGWGRYLRYRSPARLNVPWGWKDPRNTFTLPIWLDIFPEARVIHVYRHGVDVAASLRVREQRILASSIQLYKKRRKWNVYWLRLMRKGLMNSLPCLSLEGGLALWESYLEQGKAHVNRLGGSAIEIRYEDFVAEPLETIATLADFCEITTDHTTIDAARIAKTDRAFAYRGKLELQDFADQAAERLHRWGY